MLWPAPSLFVVSVGLDGINVIVAEAEKVLEIRCLPDAGGNLGAI